MFIDKEGIRRSLVWHSSPVDWCEPNYATFPWVVEFYNTFSNLLFLIFPPILIYLSRGYAKRVNAGIQMIWAFFMIVGVSSMYFHATLTLMGQLLDELSILWVFAIIATLFCPRTYMPSFVKSRAQFSAFFWTLIAIISILSVWRPYINAFAQMFMVVIPTVIIFTRELKKVKNKDRKIFDLGVRSMIIGIAAVTIWFNDRIFCDFYLSHGITYLHAVWHVLCFFATYALVVMSSYFYLKIERPEILCELAYWPSESVEILNIPYVRIIESKKDGRSKKII